MRLFCAFAAAANVVSQTSEEEAAVVPLSFLPILRIFYTDEPLRSETQRCVGMCDARTALWGARIKLCGVGVEELLSSDGARSYNVEGNHKTEKEKEKKKNANERFAYTVRSFSKGAQIFDI